MENLKFTVRCLLLLAVEELLGTAIPDLYLGFEVSKASRDTASWGDKYDAIVRQGERTANELEAHEARELAWAHRKVAAAMLQALRGAAGVARLRRCARSQHCPPDLRAGARKLLKRLQERGRVNPWVLAYTVLACESAIEFEAAQAPEYEAQDAMSRAQRSYVAQASLGQDEYDGSPNLGALWNVCELPKRYR